MFFSYILLVRSLREGYGAVLNYFSLLYFLFFFISSFPPFLLTGVRILWRRLDFFHLYRGICVFISVFIISVFIISVFIISVFFLLSSNKGHAWVGVVSCSLYISLLGSCFYNGGAYSVYMAIKDDMITKNKGCLNVFPVVSASPVSGSSNNKRGLVDS